MCAWKAHLLAYFVDARLSKSLVEGLCNKSFALQCHSKKLIEVKYQFLSVCAHDVLVPLHLELENERRLLFIKFASDSRDDNPQVTIVNAPLWKIEEKAGVLSRHDGSFLHIFSGQNGRVPLYADGFVPSENFSGEFGRQLRPEIFLEIKGFLRFIYRLRDFPGAIKHLAILLFEGDPVVCAVIDKDTERVNSLDIVEWDRHCLHAVSDVADGACLRHDGGIRVEDWNDDFRSESILDEIRHLRATEERACRK